MRIGFFAIGIGRLTTPDWIRTVASNAERLGFASLWAPEHVVLLDRYASKYPYSSGEFPAPTDSPIGDPFITLAFAGTQPWSVLLVIIRDVWVVKVLYEVIATPVTYAIVTALKRIEGVDVYDRDTKFAPIPLTSLRSLLRWAPR